MDVAARGTTYPSAKHGRRHRCHRPRPRGSSPPRGNAPRPHPPPPPTPYGQTPPAAATGSSMVRRLVGHGGDASAVGASAPTALQAVGRRGAPGGHLAAHPGHVRAADGRPTRRRRTTGGVTRRRCRRRGGALALQTAYRAAGRRSRRRRDRRDARARDAGHGCRRVDPPAPPAQGATAGTSCASRAARGRFSPAAASSDAGGP